ncbi:hypothetical protein ACFE04_029086 [Oxalis oulophora]
MKFSYLSPFLSDSSIGGVENDIPTKVDTLQIPNPAADAAIATSSRIARASHFSSPKATSRESPLPAKWCTLYEAHGDVAKVGLGRGVGEGAGGCEFSYTNFANGDTYRVFSFEQLFPSTFPPPTISSVGEQHVEEILKRVISKSVSQFWKKWADMKKTAPESVGGLQVKQDQVSVILLTTSEAPMVSHMMPSGFSRPAKSPELCANTTRNIQVNDDKSSKVGANIEKTKRKKIAAQLEQSIPTRIFTAQFFHSFTFYTFKYSES